MAFFFFAHWMFMFSEIRHLGHNTDGMLFMCFWVVGLRWCLAFAQEKPNKSSAVAEMDRKEGAVLPLSLGAAAPHVTQSGLSRGLPPYQVAS